MKTGLYSFIGVLILLGFTFLGAMILIQSDREVQRMESESTEYRYELVPVNEQNIIIFDKKTGESWRKFIDTNEGPTEWEHEVTPIKKLPK